MLVMMPAPAQAAGAETVNLVVVDQVALPPTRAQTSQTQAPHSAGECFAGT